MGLIALILNLLFGVFAYIITSWALAKGQPPAELHGIRFILAVVVGIIVFFLDLAGRYLV